MCVKFTQLHCKEVICVRDGRRLGYINDIRIQVPEGKLVAIVVPAPGRFFGLLGSREDYIIPWSCIRRMGPDIVLVDICPEDCRTARPRIGFPE